MYPASSPPIYVYPLLVLTLHFYTLPMFTPCLICFEAHGSLVFPSVSTLLCARRTECCALGLIKPFRLPIQTTSPSFSMAFFHIVCTAHSVVCVLDKSLLLAQVVLTLVTLLRQPPECWGYKCVWHAQPGGTLNSSVNCSVSTGVGGHHPNRFPVSSHCRNCSPFPSLLDGLDLPLLVHFIATKPYIVYSLWEQAAFLTPLETIG